MKARFFCKIWLFVLFLPSLFAHQKILIEGRSALPLQGRTTVLGYEIGLPPENELLVLSLDLFLPTTPGTEVYFLRFSGLGAHNEWAAQSFSLAGLPVNTWTELKIICTGYTPKETEADLYLIPPPEIAHIDLDANFSEIESLEMQNQLKTLNEAPYPVYLGQAKFKNTLDLPVPDIQSIRQAYPSLWESHFAISILLGILFLLLTILCWLWPRRIGARFFAGFILPVLFGMIFFWYTARGFFTGLEEAELYFEQNRLVADWQSLLSMGEMMEAEYTRKISLLNQKLLQKIQDMRALDRRFLNNLDYGFRAMDLAYEYTVIEKMQASPKKSQALVAWDWKYRRKQVMRRGRFSADPLDLALEEIYKQTDFGYLLSNGKANWTPRSMMNNWGRALAPMFQRLIDTRSREMSQGRNELDRGDKEDFKNFRQTISQGMQDDRILEYFLNNPNRLYPLYNDISNQGYGYFNYNFWSFFAEKGYPIWFVIGQLSNQKMARRLEELARDFFQKGYWVQEGLDYYFGGQRMMHFFPLQFRNEGKFEELSRQILSKQNSRMHLSLEDGRLYQYFGNLYPKLDGYSLVIRRDLSSVFLALRDKKNLAYFGVYTVFFIFFALSLAIARRVTNPLRHIRQGIQRIENMDLTKDIQRVGQDQFAQIVDRFNSMIQELREKVLISRFLSSMALSSLQNKQEPSVRENVGILFVGIRNLKELDHPLQIMNRFVPEVQAIIVQEGGLIDKFTGTDILAIFRNTQEMEGAIRVARRIRSLIYAWNDESSEKIQVGIGLCYGSVVLGHVGANRRKDFTAIGNTVNLAARLQGLKNEARVAIFLDQSFRPFLPQDTNLGHVQLIQVKGKNEMVSVYELL